MQCAICCSRIQRYLFVRWFSISAACPIRYDSFVLRFRSLSHLTLSAFLPLNLLLDLFLHNFSRFNIAWSGMGSLAECIKPLYLLTKAAHWARPERTREHTFLSNAKFKLIYRNGLRTKPGRIEMDIVPGAINWHFIKLIWFVQCSAVQSITIHPCPACGPVDFRLVLRSHSMEFVFSALVALLAYLGCADAPMHMWGISV